MGDTPPEGVMPLFLRPTTADKYELSTGARVIDVVDYKLVAKEEIMKEIIGLGAISDFAELKTEIEAYPGEEILILGDPDQKWGETFSLCVTLEAKEAQMAALLAAKAEAEAAEAFAHDEEAQKRAEEEALLKIVYEDKPIVPRPWQADSASETAAEVHSLELRPTRPLYGLSITRGVNGTKQAYRFHPRNADVSGVEEFRSHKERSILRKEVDTAIQAAPVMSSTAAQTTWFRPVNKAVQCDESTGNNDSSNRSNTQSIGVGTDTAEDRGTYIDRVLTEPECLDCIEKAAALAEELLQQNETINIFENAFHGVGDDEGGIGVKVENELRESKNFADPKYSKNQALTAIDWIPRKNNMLAVTATRNLSFDERVDVAGQVHTSYILIWDFNQLVRPQLILQSPSELYAFRFNPTEPHLVAAGSTSGQVFVWDISEPMSSLHNRSHPHRGATVARLGRGSSGLGRGAGDEEEKEPAPELPWISSSPDVGHKRPISDVWWLHPNVHVNYRGKLIDPEHCDGKSYQFVTISGDGMLLVWDLRYQDIADGNLPHVAKAKVIPTEKGGRDGTPGHAIFCPIFRMHLKRIEGVGELSLCRLCLNLGGDPVEFEENKRRHDEEVARIEEARKQAAIESAGSGAPPRNPEPEATLPEFVDRRTQIMCASEEGDIVLADVRPDEASGGAAKPAAATAKEDDDEEADGSPDYVRWMGRDHSRPCVSLEQSPFFPGLILSVSDWMFQIWKLGDTRPLFSSPQASSYYTGGRWSPTRPAVLLISCADGSVHAWDFTDTSYHASVELKATHTRISSMEFLQSKPVNLRQQLLAIGDISGTLHVFEMPRNLIRPNPNEKQIMANFVDRERNRVQFVADRIRVRKAEADALAGDEDDIGFEVGGDAAAAGGDEAAAAAAETGADGTAPEVTVAVGGVGGVGGRDDVGGVGAGEEDDDELNEEEEQLQAEYRALQAKFIEDLNLAPDELPEYLRNAPAGNESNP